MKCRTTNLFRKCQGFQLEASRRARVIRSERAGSALGTVPGAAIGNCSGGSARMPVRFFIGLYTSSYTRHSEKKEVLDDDSSQLLVAGQNGMVPSRSNESCEGAPHSLIRETAPNLPEVIDLESILSEVFIGPEQTCEGLTDEEIASLGALLLHDFSENTRRNYLSQWRRFQAWAAERNVESRPADPLHIAAYLLCRLNEGRKPATLRASVNAISHMHKIVGEADPCSYYLVRRILSAVTRQMGGSQKQAPPLKEKLFRKIQAVACQPRVGKGGHLERPETARERGALDIAMIGMMRDGLLRVSEAAAVVWDDIEWRSNGTGRLAIRRSKTDQVGKGAVAYLSRPTMSYLKMIRNGAAGANRVIGLRPDQIGRRIKRAALQAGLGRKFSGHSCRVGMACDLAREGIDLPRIMVAGRWDTLEMVAHYTRSERAGWNAVSEYYTYELRG